MHDVHYRYWTSRDRQDLERAGTSLSEMQRIAIRVALRMPPGLHLVSGPITTGGVGTITGNLLVFRRVIERLADAEYRNIFSQLPFETGMVEFHRIWKAQNPNETYCWPILREFYDGLFATGRFAMFHFIHGFRSSIGACWEHDCCQIYSIRKRYLPRQWSTEIMCELTTATGEVSEARSA